MRAILVLALLSSLAACGGDDHATDADLTLLDDASDEVWVTLEDMVGRGEVETNDDVAAQLITPTDAAAVPSDEPVWLDWSPTSSLLRHGRTTGDFVWLRIDCGLDEPIDVMGIESTAWTMDSNHWTAVVEAGGPCEVAVVSAYVDRGIVTEGPYRPSATTSFSIE